MLGTEKQVKQAKEIINNYEKALELKFEQTSCKTEEKFGASKENLSKAVKLLYSQSTGQIIYNELDIRGYVKNLCKQNNIKYNFSRLLNAAKRLERGL